MSVRELLPVGVSCRGQIEIYQPGLGPVSWSGDDGAMSPVVVVCGARTLKCVLVRLKDGSDVVSKLPRSCGASWVAAITSVALLAG